MSTTSNSPTFSMDSPIFVPSSPALSDSSTISTSSTSYTSCTNSTLSFKDEKELSQRIMYLSRYQEEKNSLLRELVRLDPKDPMYPRNIRDLKRSLRHAELFICSYQVLLKEITAKCCSC